MLGRTEKEIIGGIVALFVIVVIVSLIYTGGSEKRDSDLPDESSVSGEEEMAPVEGFSEVESDVVLEDFPDGLPIEDRVVASESYKHIPGDGAGEQSTLSYTSALSMEKNFSNFMSFVSENGYSIENEVEEENVRFVYATNGSSDLSVLIRETGGRILVNISFLEKKI